MKKIIFSLLVLALVVPEPALALYQTNSSATVVVGQSVLDYSFGVAVGNLPNQGDYADGIKGPSDVFFDGTRLFVTDYNNNRVLIYNQIPTENGASADVVIGQPELHYSNKANQSGSVGANTLYRPSSVFSDGTKLFITDGGNNRVLIYNSIPTENNASADVVIGQPDMVSNSANQGGDVGANTLDFPQGLYATSSQLFITDFYNSRILIYNSIPETNNASADVVIGQADFTHNSFNRGGSVGANTLSLPFDVYSDGFKLLIADMLNHRILIYNSIPETNGASADLVIGQSALTNATYGTAANRLICPQGVFFDGNKLFITDTSNSRVLIYNSIPVANNASANIVVGQASMTANSRSAAVNKLSMPYSVFSDGEKLFISDYSNNRVLIYNDIPEANGASADVVIGQNVFNLGTANNGGDVNSNTSYSPMSSFFDGTRFFVADTFNHRVLIYNSIPTENNAIADVVIGQPDMVSNSSNQGGSPGANTLYEPRGVFSDGTKLLVADNKNYRVLIYNEIPTENNAEADLVIGQADFTHNSSNRGGSVADNTLNQPTHIYIVDGKIIITDNHNHRILIYNEIPTENGASADVVVGQADFTHNSSNRGGSVADNTLSAPNNVFSDGERLFIPEYDNHRVLIYNEIPTENGASADVVVGQADFTHNSANRGGSVAANTLSSPYGVYADDTRLYIADFSNNRVLIYNQIPTENGASADVVVGQADFTHNSSNQGGDVGASTLYYPSHLYSDDTRLFVTDMYNHRVLIYPLGPENTSASAPDKVIPKTVTLNLSASADTKEVMISEDPNFGGASWQTYSSTIDYTLSDSFGVKTLYVKFRDYANYESGPITLSVQYVGQGGGGLPASFSAPPQAPIAGTSFTVTINNNQTTTNNREVTLNFNTGSDTTRIAISEDPNFTNAPLLDYAPTMNYTLSEGNGLKTIYIKFYTQYGYATEPISASITLNAQASPTVQSPALTPGSNYVAKLIKYPDSPTVYLINQNNEKQPFTNPQAFTERNYQWSAIETVSPENTWPTGETLYPSNQTEQVQPSWNPPTGYEYISSPSQLPNYSNIISEPNSPRKYGLPKRTATSNTYQFKNYLYYGLRDNQEVKLLQELLKTLGYLTGIINWPGTYDSVTVKAVRSLQQEHNITPNTGNVGPKTRAVLNGMR